MFFSFDGMDGVGKSTQLELFADHLRGLGQDVVTCRDPGSTTLGELIRDIVLQDHETPIGARAEMLLYMAARAQLVKEIIEPALSANRVVVADRFLLSNVVYQGHGAGLDPDAIWRVGQTATEGIFPDLMFVLDMRPEDAATRLSNQLDRMERRGAEYRLRLRDGFLKEAEKDPDRIVVVDASGTIEQVQSRIQKSAAKVLNKSCGNPR